MTLHTIPVNEVLDHAGAYYPWFSDVREEENGDLVIEVPEHYSESETVETYLITPVELWDAVHKFEDRNEFGDYEAQFLSDLIAGRFDVTDGDMNIVDAILQFAAFGEVVFG